MQVKPNHTVLKGLVRAIRPEADGWGADVEIQVEENESQSAEDDYLRPEPGSVLNAFSAEPGKLKVGDHVRVRASLRAGPFGGRTVLESVTPAEEAESSETEAKASKTAKR